MRDAVRRLPWRERVVVEDHYWRGAPLQEIAVALRLSPGRVSQLHARAVWMLRAALNEETKPCEKP